MGEGKHCAGDKLKIAQEVRSPVCDREGEPGIVRQERMTGCSPTLVHFISVTAIKAELPGRMKSRSVGLEGRTTLVRGCCRTLAQA